MPVIYVDGIRVENGASSISVGVGGQTPSRLNDIDPNDLERVQVAGGPSANVLYGTDAANGVITLQAKQGKVGPTVWDIYAEGGVLNDVTTYPANYRGVDSAEAACTLITSVRATNPCTQTALRSFNPLAGYFAYAAESPDLNTIFTNYLSTTGYCLHCAGHPPGASFFFWLVVQAVSFLPGRAWLEHDAEFRVFRRKR